MPDVLWPLFRDNPHLAQALPALAAAVIQAIALAKYGSRVGLIPILHTFNGKLEFNSHVHMLVTAGGQHASSSSWTSRVYYKQDELMELWREGVIELLRAALCADRLHTDVAHEQVKDLLTEQENRWWSIRVQSFRSKEHFLRYAARYVKRPPIAQRRITWIDERTVGFWYRDKKLGRRVEVQCSIEEFVDRWAQHIPDRYQHAVRSFGLFASRTLRHTSIAVFALLKQVRRLRPKPLPWAYSIKRDFGWDPLLDQRGQRMKWMRRLAPAPST